MIDTSTNIIVDHVGFPLGADTPLQADASPDGKKVYVANFGLLAPSITVFDRVSRAHKTIGIKTIPGANLPGVDTPISVTMSRDNTEAYIPSPFAVNVFDVRTDQIVRTIHYPDIPLVAVDGPDGLLYVGFATGFVAGFNRYTGALVKPPIFTDGVALSGLVFNKDGTKLYVETFNSMTVIDATGWSLIKTIATSADGQYSLLNPGGGFMTPSGLTPDGSKLYVPLLGRANVLVIDTHTDQIVRDIPTNGTTGGVVISADGSRGYITDLQNGPDGFGAVPPNVADIFLHAYGPGRIIVFDPHTDEVLGSIPVGRGPAGLTWAGDIS